jgi:DNA-binding transcriptional ArsR family regulator
MVRLLMSHIARSGDFQAHGLTVPKRDAILNYMVKYYSEQLDKTFFALSDPIRRSILAHLSSGQATVLQLAEPYQISIPAVSKHLKLLEKANLVTRTKKGRIHYMKLNPDPLKEANEWIELYQAFWKDQFASLNDYLKNMSVHQVQINQAQQEGEPPCPPQP